MGHFEALSHLYMMVAGPVLGGETNTLDGAPFEPFLLQRPFRVKWWKLLSLPLEGRLVKFWNVQEQLEKP